MLEAGTTRWVVRVAAVTGLTATLASVWVLISPLVVGLTTWVELAARWLPGTTVTFAQQSASLGFRFLPLVGGLALIIAVMTSLRPTSGRSRALRRLWLTSVMCLAASSATSDLWALPASGVRAIIISLCVSFGVSLVLLALGHAEDRAGRLAERAQLWMWAAGGLFIALFVTLPLGVVLIAAALAMAAVRPHAIEPTRHPRDA